MGKKIEKMGQFAAKGSEYVEKGEKLLQAATMLFSAVGAFAQALTKNKK